MAQAAQGFALDLADALACETELFTHLFEGVIVTILQSKAQAQDARLSRRERVKHFLDLLAQQLGIRALDGCGGHLILHEPVSYTHLTLPTNREV